MGLAEMIFFLETELFISTLFKKKCLLVTSSKFDLIFSLNDK